MKIASDIRRLIPSVAIFIPSFADKRDACPYLSCGTLVLSIEPPGGVIPQR